MTKKFIVGLLCLLSIGFLLYGCGKVVEERGIGILPGGVNPGDPIPNPRVTVAGTTFYSGGNISANLAPMIPPGSTTSISGLNKSRISVYISSKVSGTSAMDIRASAVTWAPVDFTVTETTTSEIDMAFILDNTGSMAGRIQGVKDSITAFTTSLEAMGGDIRFAGDAFGDYVALKANMHPLYVVEFDHINFPVAGTGATEIANWLNGLSAYHGNDYPENPLDALMYAYNNFTWRPTARKVLIVITDNACHQINTTSPEANYPESDTSYASISDYSIDYGDPGISNSTEINVVDLLKGSAVVYAISPKSTSVKDNIDWHIRDGHGDVRNLADGLGGSSRYGTGNYPTNGTGGLWIELPNSGVIDLMQLGISGTLIAGSVTLTLPYTLGPGTYYIMVYVDTDGNGTADSYGMLTIVVS
jgi:hypothetical protein